MTAPPWGAILTTQRLADVARPARGRTLDRHLLFSIVPAEETQDAGNNLVAMVALSAGATRVGDVVIDIAVDLEQTARILSSPVTVRVPNRRLFAVQETYRALQHRSPHVLLAGHCAVLWPQVAAQVRLS